ncbi:putative ribonuclease H-like domain-containing protein [Tanacetum coccineum]|uniref:Ribonuclease H-like domain-containing protein n=1 Tax=Tanacetum coccineum TaxID=301880 RepID=A0ABQ4XE08_9ASTR
MNFSVFNCSKEDSVGKPLYNRFIKTNDFKGVPHPLSGDYTPTPQEEIDESLYVYGKKGPQEPEPNVSDDRSSEYSTCQSNDSAGSIGTSSEHSVDPESEISSVPPEVYVSTPITTNEKVQLKTGRPNINSVRTNINTGRTNINSVRPRVNTVNTNVNTVRSRQPVPTRTSNTQMSHSHAIKRNWGTAVKTSAVYNWRNSKSNSNCDSGSTFFKTDHPLKNMVDRGIFDSGCSGHMTCNKDQLEDFEEFNGGSVTFGGSKGYISGKGKIRILFGFSLASKDETSGILQNFIRQIENQLSHRVKIIRSDNGTEFKNRDMLEFCGNKGIKQEYSNARTPQQNGVAERMNRTLIEAARTMLYSFIIYVGSRSAVNTGSLIHDDRSPMPEPRLPTEIEVSPTPTLRSPYSPEKSNRSKETDHQRSTSIVICRFLFLKEEPKKISKALTNDSLFKPCKRVVTFKSCEQVWVSLDLPHGNEGDWYKIGLLEKKRRREEWLSESGKNGWP